MTTEETQMIAHFGTEQVHIDNIRGGDTIIHNGKMRTVNKEFISYGGFMGTSVFGDSYCLGNTKVTKVLLS
jgi:hypothetical protein